MVKSNHTRQGIYAAGEPLSADNKKNIIANRQNKHIAYKLCLFHPLGEHSLMPAGKCVTWQCTMGLFHSDSLGFWLRHLSRRNCTFTNSPLFSVAGCNDTLYPLLSI